MRYMSFRRPDGTPSFGRVDGDAVVDLAAPGGPLSLKEALVAGSLATLAERKRFAISDVTVLPVIPDPGKILCVGLNYETHRQETGRKAADYPAIFTRYADTLVADGQPLVRPAVSD